MAIVMADENDLSSVAACNPVREFRPKGINITKDYEIFADRLLGSGGNANIYACKSRTSNVEHAVKVLPDTQESMLEAELHWQACVSDSIVKVEDVYRTRWVDGQPAILLVMEYMRGGDLFDYIKKRGEQPFTEPQAAAIIKQIAKAVAFLHNMNMAHRDLKLENFMLQSESINSTLKLTDFGCAGYGTSRNMSQYRCGTLYYFPPEVLLSKEYDKSCDMWALGVVLYSLLSGCYPFYASSGAESSAAALSPSVESRIVNGTFSFPSPEWSHISHLAKDLIRQLFATDPKKRLTVEGLLEHPWVRGDDRRSLPYSI